MNWRDRIKELLATEDAPRLPSTQQLGDLYLRALAECGKAHGGGSLAQDQRFMIWLRQAHEVGDIGKIHRGAYVNRHARPEPTQAEVAHIMRPSAVVSLNTVLGDSADLNNPSRIVFAIISGDSPDAGRFREERNGVGDYRFIAMHPDLYGAGAMEDRLDPSFPYPRATRERALCDWLVIGDSNRHPAKRLPPMDMDIDEMDMARLERLAGAMGIEATLQRWLEKNRLLRADPDVDEQSSSRLGF